MNLILNETNLEDQNYLSVGPIEIPRVALVLTLEKNLERVCPFTMKTSEPSIAVPPNMSAAGMPLGRADLLSRAIRRMFPSEGSSEMKVPQ